VATDDPAIALLWGRPAGPRRGPKPALSLETIAGTGIAIADADGLAAVTMQRVAEALGVTKMALYRYVPGKSELVALMTETALGAPPDLGERPWRAALQEWSLRMYDRCRRHPWTLRATVGARVVGPHEMGWLEQAVAALAGTGLAGGEVLDVAATLAGHVRMVAEQGAATEAPEKALESVYSVVLRGREDQFPALTAALRSVGADGGQDRALDFGLGRILDGVEHLIAAREAAAGGRAARRRPAPGGPRR
jgi:AcrR family transcriptional regulator